MTCSDEQILNQLFALDLCAKYMTEAPPADVQERIIQLRDAIDTGVEMYKNDTKLSEYDRGVYVEILAGKISCILRLLSMTCEHGITPRGDCYLCVGESPLADRFRNITWVE